MWSGRDLRYCGACGARLPTPDPAQPGRLARFAARALTGVAAVVAIGGLAFAVTGDRLSLGAPHDPRVELPDSAPDLADNPLTDDEAEELLQQVDPNRLRCEPRGCEVWRRDRDAMSGVASVADLVVVLERNRLVALDRDTAEERWTAPVGHLRSVTSDGEQLRSTGGYARIYASQDGDGVLLVTGTEVSHIGLDGNRTWSHPSEPGTAWHSAPLPDILVLHGRQTTGNSSRVMGLDPQTGETRWAQWVESVQVVEPDVIVVTGPGRSLRALDPSTGFTRWERSIRLGRWAQRIGPWVAHHRESGLSLLDLDTGERVGSLAGYPTQPVLRAGELWLALVARTEGGWTGEHVSPWVLFGLSDDAEVAWALPIDQPPGLGGCCPLLLSDDERTVSVVGLRSVVEVDAVTGEILGESYPVELFGDGDAGVTDASPGNGDTTADGPRATTAATQPGGTSALRLTDDGTLVHRLHDGHVVVTTPDGRRVEVRAGELSIESLDPLVIGSPDHLMGIQAIPER